MGVNLLRLYKQPFELNKDLLRQMYEEYGIYVAMGDFLGKYTHGSKASWEVSACYDNKAHQDNMLESVQAMVENYKDEEFVLFWILGNENVYGAGCNANKKPDSFFKFVNKAAKLIKSLDPMKRPIAIASGDALYLNKFAQFCPDVDIFGTNSYRGKYGFLDLWQEIKRIADKPSMISEYGVPAFAMGYTNKEAENFQADYHKANWLDIVNNSAGSGSGIAIGGFIFEWIDEWWKAYEPFYHDRKGLFSGPFLDGYMHEEWLGITGQGQGKNSPFLRVLRPAYYVYKQLWNKQ